MPVADEKNEPLRKSTLQLNLGGRSPSNRNLNMLGSRLNLAGSKFNLAQQQDPQALLQAAMESGQRIYENNYQLKPAKKFRSEAVRQLIDQILKKHLTGVAYQADKAPELSKQISTEIISGVKQFGFDRYKFVVEVNIVEAKGQGIRIASRCLWDTNTDSCASASFKSATLFAVGIVFGCYFE